MPPEYLVYPVFTTFSFVFLLPVIGILVATHFCNIEKYIVIIYSRHYYYNKHDITCSISQSCLQVQFNTLLQKLCHTWTCNLFSSMYHRTRP